MGRPKGSKNGVSAHDRFWQMVDMDGDHWLWTGAVNAAGIGSFWIDPKHWISAHRFSYIEAYGPIPDELEVLHKCDIPLCVHPEDLFVGTQADNMLDMAQKLRAHGGYKLTNEIVLSIRAEASSGVAQSDLADTYSITPSMISMIINRKRYPNI